MLDVKDVKVFTYLLKIRKNSYIICLYYLEELFKRLNVDIMHLSCTKISEKLIFVSYTNKTSSRCCSTIGPRGPRLLVITYVLNFIVIVFITTIRPFSLQIILLLYPLN